MSVARFSPARLRALREERELSRVELAFAVRRTEQSVYLWESGRTTPTVEILAEIAATLEVPVSDLFEQEPERV